MNNRGSETRYTYDPLGRLETVTQTKLLGVDLTAYGDDGWGNIRADGNVEATRYRYDLQGAIGGAEFEWRLLFERAGSVSARSSTNETSPTACA